MSRRRCFHKCTGKLPLFSLPKEDEVRNKWLKFIFTTIPQQYNPNLLLCSTHFTDNCFLNQAQFAAGFLKRLQLRDGAVPTLLGQYEESGSQPSTSQQDPGTHHLSTSVQFNEIRQTASVGTDPVASPKMVKVGTQLSMGTLKNPVRSKATQATASSRSVGTETTFSNQDFTPIRAPGFRPSKRPRFVLEEEEEGATSSESQAKPHDSTYDPGDSVITKQSEMTSSASPQSAPHQDQDRICPPIKKEDIPDFAPNDVCVNIACLLQLFCECRKCKGECVVCKHGDQKHFTVIQHCKICNQQTTWTSQLDMTSEIPDINGKNQIQHAQCDVKEGDQESTASMRVKERMDRETDGELCLKTSLLTERKVGSPLNGKDVLPCADLELTVELGLSEGSQSGGEEEKEGAAGESKKEIEKEEVESETEEEESGMDEEDEEWEMDEEDEEWEMDEEDEEWEMDEDEKLKMDVVRRVRKRPYRETDNNRDQHSRRRKLIKKAQQRTGTLCTDCGIFYTTMTHKCDPNKRFRCPGCGISCQNELNLDIHRNGICRSSSNPCIFCLKPFKTWQERLDHETIHSGTEPYECTECPQKFTKRLTRNRHLKKHQKRVRCQICDKEFTQNHKLVRHELSHSKDKPFKCKVCDRTFAQACQLKSHLRVHTGEKPFHCQLCNKGFNHNVSLKNHIRRHHQGENSITKP